MSQVLRRDIVANRTLSHFAWAYGFGARLVVGPSAATERAGEPLARQQNTLADLFEAYVAALHLSEGLGRVEQWLERLLSSAVMPTLEADATELVLRGIRTADRATMHAKRDHKEAFGNVSGALVLLAGGGSSLKTPPRSAVHTSKSKCESCQSDSVLGLHTWDEVAYGRSGWHSIWSFDGGKLGCGRGPKQQDARWDAVANYVRNSPR